MIKRIDNITIDIISARLKNVVSPLDIIKWLNNFEENEIKYAIDIASNLTVYTSYEIEEIINSSLNNLFPKLEANDIIIINPIGNFGKKWKYGNLFFSKNRFP